MTKAQSVIFSEGGKTFSSAPKFNFEYFAFFLFVGNYDKKLKLRKLRKFYNVKCVSRVS